MASAAWTLPAQAQAQAHDAEARVHFRLGRAYYDSGRFEDAAHEFQQAYDLSQRNDLLHNVFVAWRDAGQLGPAITALRQYITSLAPGDRERFQAQVRNMERVYRAQQHAGVDTTSDGSSGTNGSTVDTTNDGNSGTNGSTVDTTTTNDGSTSPAINGPATDESHGPGAAPWILMGSGGVLLIGGALTGIMALSAQSDLKDQCDASGMCPAGWESTRDRGQTLAVVTDVLMIGGGLVVAGGLLWLVLGRHPSSEREPSVALACAPGGCAASARFVF